MLFGLAFVLGMAASVFFIWLAVIAFRKSVAWGLVALLVPLGNVFFAVKHWADSKKPFLAGLACSVLGVFVLFAGMGLGVKQMTDQVMNDPEFKQAMQEMQAMQRQPGQAGQGEDVPAPSVANADAVPVPADSASEPVEPDPAEQADDAGVMEITVVDEDGVKPLEPARRANRNQIRIRQAADHVGATMRIIGNSRVDTVARLVGVDNDKLQFEQDLGGGMVVFEMRQNEIASLELLR